MQDGKRRVSASHIPSRFVFASGGTPEVGQPGSRRSQNKDRTRRALLDAADELFLAKGYEATTLDEICEKAGISLRTFFRYFESKRDLALYENMRNMSRLRELLARPHTPEQLLDELEALYDFMALEFEQGDEARRRLFRMAGEPELAGRSLMLDLDTETRIAAALTASGTGPRRGKPRRHHDRWWRAPRRVRLDRGAGAGFPARRHRGRVRGHPEVAARACCGEVPIENSHLEKRLVDLPGLAHV